MYVRLILELDVEAAELERNDCVTDGGAGKDAASVTIRVNEF